jgi:phosphopantothenoylcysteine decarboxylase/phosphopantothenate--cysteine ligase
MGAALAMSAWLMGAETTYIAGPVAEAPPAGLAGLEVIRVETTADLLAEVRRGIEGAWALIMNAAPADFRPAARVKGKIRKGEGEPTELRLERTDDILKAIIPDKGKTIVVGFAAEPGELEARAREKMAAKSLDYIAANLAGGPDDAFGSETISLKVLSSAGGLMSVGPASKFEAARTLLGALAEGWR